MELNEIKNLLKTNEYDFLRTNEHLGKNIILITLGGSHADGTNIDTSDCDIRGCALNTKEEILTNKNFEQFVNEDTDTTIYSFNKLIHLLTNANPNTIEILGCKPEHYLYLSSIGQELLDHKYLFLSKKCVYAFGGYANAQLRRLDNKAARLVSQSEQEMHILRSIEHASETFRDHFFNYDDDHKKIEKPIVYKQYEDETQVMGKVFNQLESAIYAQKKNKIAAASTQNAVNPTAKYERFVLFFMPSLPCRIV